GNLQDLAPRLEEVVIQDLGGVARVEHDSRPSSTHGPPIHHRKTGPGMQTGQRADDGTIAPDLSPTLRDKGAGFDPWSSRGHTQIDRVCGGGLRRAEPGFTHPTAQESHVPGRL